MVDAFDVEADVPAVVTAGLASVVVEAMSVFSLHAANTTAHNSRTPAPFIFKGFFIEISSSLFVK
ncbi:hypothetical protein D3C71_2140770 [compost metagenome]